MSEQLFNHFADLSALAKEKEDVKKIFKEIEDGIAKLSDLGFKIDSAKGIAELNAANKQLAKTQNDLLGAQRKLEDQEKKLITIRAEALRLAKENAGANNEQANSQNNLSSAQTGTAQSLLELKSRLDEVREKMSKLKEFGDLIEVSPELKAELIGLTEEEVKLGVQISQTRNLLKAEQKEFIASSASIEEAKAKLFQYRRERDNLNLSTPEGLSKKDFYNKEIDALDEFIKANTDALSKQKLNVGAYAQSLEPFFNTLTEKIEKLKAEQKDLQNTGFQNHGRTVVEGFTPTTNDPDRLNQVNAELDRLNRLQEVGFKMAGSYAQQINTVDKAIDQLAQDGNVGADFVKELNDSLRGAKISGSNFTGSAKIIADAYEHARQKVEQFNKENKTTGPEVEKARLEFDALGRIVDNPQFLNVAGKVGDITAETRFFTKALADLEAQGQKDSEVYKQMELRLAHLTDLMGDTRAEVKALSSDTRGFDLFASGVGTVASSFQTAASAAELFGSENQDVQKSIQKLVAIQNISNGIRQIANDVTTRGTAANKAYAFVQAQVAVFTNASTTATQRWRAALNLTGIGLLITGLALIADKMGIFGGSTANTGKELEKFNEALDRQNNLLDRNSKKIQQATDRNVLLIRASGAARAKAEAEAVASLPNGQKELKELKDKNEIESKIRAATIIGLSKEANQREKAANQIVAANKTLITAYGLVVTDVASAQDALEFAQIRGDEKLEGALKNVVSNYEKAQDARTQIANINIEGRIKKIDGETDSEKKAAEKRKKYAEDERKAALELYKFRLGIAADYQEQLKELEGLPVQKRVDAGQSELELRKQSIVAQRDFDLRQEGATASAKVLIREKAADEIRKLELKISQEVVRIRIEEKNRLKLIAQEEAEFFQQGVSDRAMKETEAARKNFEAYEIALEGYAQAEKQVALKRRNGGTITEKEYQAEIEHIDENSQKVRLSNLITFYEKQLSVLKAAGVDTADAEKALSQAKLDLSNFELADAKKAHELEVSLIEQRKEKYKELGQAITEAFANVIGGAYDAQKNAIQEQIDDIDRLKEADIARITASGDAEETKAARVKLIESKAQADKEALERRSKQIDRQKAVFDRTFKVFQVTTSGIESVAKIKATVAELSAKAALNPLLLPLIPIAAAQIPITIATTAAQIAGILATPIPKFAKGTHHSPAGWAIVGEEGRELVETPKGERKLVEKPTRLWLERGSKVIPNPVTEKMLKSGIKPSVKAFINNIFPGPKSVKSPKPTIQQKPFTDLVPIPVKKIYKKSDNVVVSKVNETQTPESVFPKSLLQLSREVNIKITPSRVARDISGAAHADIEKTINAQARPEKQVSNNNNSDVLAELKNTNKELKELNKKSRIVIINEQSIETSAYYQQQMRN